jgi:hypothetical protein
VRVSLNQLKALLQLIDTDQIAWAEKGKRFGRKALEEVAQILRLETILAWCRNNPDVRFRSNESQSIREATFQFGNREAVRPSERPERFGLLGLEVQIRLADFWAAGIAPTSRPEFSSQFLTRFLRDASQWFATSDIGPARCDAVVATVYPVVTSLSRSDSKGFNSRRLQFSGRVTG